MGCEGCVNSVEGALSSLEGVDSVEVKLQEGIAEVYYEESVVSEDSFEKAVDEAGYTMTGVKA